MKAPGPSDVARWYWQVLRNPFSPEDAVWPELSDPNEFVRNSALIALRGVSPEGQRISGYARVIRGFAVVLVLVYLAAGVVLGIHVPNPLAFAITSGVGVLVIAAPSAIFRFNERASRRRGAPAAYPKNARRAIYVTELVLAALTVAMVCVWGAYGPWHNGTVGSVLWAATLLYCTDTTILIGAQACHLYENYGTAMPDEQLEIAEQSAPASATD
jgi:hypothetical protein